MNMVKSTIIVFLMTVLFSGCATAPKGILEKNSVMMTTGETLSTDARLRVITYIKPGIASRPGKVDPNVITCTEPSPDVAATLANSAGFGISVFGQGSASLSGSQVEGIAQLAERTAGIQALLHQGYQACLDYANGAITSTTYSLRTSRLDDLLVTMILGETAGGAFGRSGAAIGTKASSEAQARLAGFPEMMKDLDKAKKELSAVEQKVKEKEDAYTQAETAFQNATDINSQTLKAERDAKKAELEAVVAEKNAIIQKLSAQAEAVSSSASEVNKLSTMGGIDAQPNIEIAKELGEMQRRFLEKDIAQGYVSACLIELGQWEKPNIYAKELAVAGTAQITGAVTGKQQLSADNTRAFFYGVQLTQEGTKLTDHCERYLPDFIQQVEKDRHLLKLKELEIESKRLDINRQISEVSDDKEATHPMAAFNLLEKDKSVLGTKKAELTDTAIPAVGGSFTETHRKSTDDEKNAFIKLVESQLSRSTTALSASEKTIIEAFDKEYLNLMADTMRSGTPSEKKLWDAAYKHQQAKAEKKNDELKKLSREINTTISDVATFIKKVKSINNK